MLLTIDIGNTETVIGLWLGDDLDGHWRVATLSEQTSDEKAVQISALLSFADHRISEVTGVCLASVVPAAAGAWREMLGAYRAVELLAVDSRTAMGLEIEYDRPDEIGADRLANAVGGFARYGGPLIIVDFGTATTFDAVSARPAYLGGAIAPGVLTGAQALFRSAARLSGVALEAPDGYIGKTSEAGLKSGLIYGCARMVDGMVTEMRQELGMECKVIATGGLTEIVAPHCRSIDEVEPLLTLIGLKRIWDLSHT
jgi:type III pantothenate kinase